VIGMPVLQARLRPVTVCKCMRDRYRDHIYAAHLGLVEEAFRMAECEKAREIPKEEFGF
jgi:hypothetical protein